MMYRPWAVDDPQADAWVARGVALVLLTAVLSGCSYVPEWANPIDWWDRAAGREGARDNADLKKAEAKAAADKGFPDLHTVPPRPTGFTTPEEREAIKRGLIADRANAKYLEQEIRQATDPSAVDAVPQTEADDGQVTPEKPDAPQPQSQVLPPIGPLAPVTTDNPTPLMARLLERGRIASGR